jgi:hypothetical protein
MAIYKLIKIEANQPEKVMELSESDFNTLCESVQQYENYLEDSQPMFDEEDPEEFNSWQEANDEFEKFDEKLIRFIHG